MSINSEVIYEHQFMLCEDSENNNGYKITYYIGFFYNPCEETKDLSILNLVKHHVTIFDKDGVYFRVNKKKGKKKETIFVKSNIENIETYANQTFLILCTPYANVDIEITYDNIIVDNMKRQETNNLDFVLKYSVINNYKTHNLLPNSVCELCEKKTCNLQPPDTIYKLD